MHTNNDALRRPFFQVAQALQVLSRDVRIGMDNKGRALDKEAAPEQLQFLCFDNLGH